MDSLRLGDGAPVWDGAAIVHDGGMHDLVDAITDDGPSSSHYGWEVDPSTVTLNLAHRPTFLALVEMIAKRKGLEIWIKDGGIEVGTMEKIEGWWFDMEVTPENALEIWRAVDKGDG